MNATEYNATLRRLTRREAVGVLKNDGCPERFAVVLAELLARCGDEYIPKRGRPFLVIAEDTADWADEPPGPRCMGCLGTGHMEGRAGDCPGCGGSGRQSA